MNNNTTTTTPDALTAFLSEPLISGIVAAAPTLATRAAAARADRAEIVRQRDAARAAAASATGSGAPTADGPAPIIRAHWTPESVAVDPTFTPPADMVSTIDAAIRACIPVLLTGPQGTGKTEAAQHVAAKQGRACYIIDCGPVRDASDWFGAPTLVNGRIGWQDSTLVAALATPDAVIVLDEINRAHTAAHSALLPLMDRRRRVTFPQRPEPVAIADGVTFICTANIGIHHVGTSTITPALASRLLPVPTDYLSEPEEIALILARVPETPRAWAERLALVAATTRATAWAQQGGEAISTREVLTVAALARALVQGGASRDLALRGLIARQPDDAHGQQSPRAQLASVIAREYGISA